VKLPLLLALLALAGCTTPAPPPGPIEDPFPAAAIAPLLSLEGCEVVQVTHYVPAATVQDRLPAGYVLTQELAGVATRLTVCARGSLEDRTLAAPSMVLSFVDVQPPAGANATSEHRFALDLAVDPPALADWFAARGASARPGLVLRTAGPPERFVHESAAAAYGATVLPGVADAAEPRHFLLHLPGPGNPVALDVRMDDQGELAAALFEAERGPLADLGTLPLSAAPASRFASAESWTPT
jgi:hypothetical protein